MPSDTPPDIALLLRFLAGDASSVEQQRVAEWLRADPSGERARLLESLRHGGRAVPLAANAASAWARMRGDMKTGGSVISRGPVATGPYSERSAWWRVVTWAVVASLVVGLIGIVRGTRGRTASREYVTRAAQRLDVTLQDGTRIALAPASRLRVPVDYASGNRGVTLDGEAYFAVVHDAAHPLSVRARNAVATDIGTQFDVRAYANDRAVRVSVVEGKVLVGAARDAAGRGRSLTGPQATPAQAGLTAGDVAVIDTALAITHSADVSAIIAWTHGELVFADTPVPEALRTLSRWYGVTFVAADSAIATQHLAARFPQESAQELTNQLAAALGARYERSGETIVLHSTHR